MSDQEEKDWGEDLYKKWFRTSGRGGFLSLRPWWEAGKISIDIGEVNGAGELQGHTNVWCGIINLGLYLKAVYDGHAERLYPKKDRDGLPSAEAFVYYGGASTADGDVARILKIHHWMSGDTPDPSAFAWKTGIFVGKKGPTGAYIADMSKPKSTNLIKVSRLEMAEMHYRIDMALSAYAAQTAEWMSQFNGRRK